MMISVAFVDKAVVNADKSVALEQFPFGAAEGVYLSQLAMVPIEQRAVLFAAVLKLVIVPRLQSRPRRKWMMCARYKWHRK